MWCHHTFSCKSYTFEPLSPWDLEPDFRPCYQLAEMTLFLLASSLKKLLHIISAKCNFGEKMPGMFVYKCILLEVQSIHRSFLRWTSIELSIPTTSVVLPRRLGLCSVVRRKPTAARRVSGEKAAWGSTPLHLAAPNGNVAAAELLLYKGAALNATNNHGPGPQKREAGARHRGLPDLGTSEGFSGIETSAFFRKCLAKLWVFHTKKCETCREQWSQCNMPIMCGKRINVVEKMPWNVFDVFVNVFCFKSKIFIVRLSVERV